MDPMARNLFRIAQHGEIFPLDCTPTELAEARSARRWDVFFAELEKAVDDGIAYELRSGDPLNPHVREHLLTVAAYPTAHNILSAVNAMDTFDNEDLR